MSTPAVDLQDLEFGWPGDRTILAIERFTVARGERLFVRGASGSGKSTLLGVIGGVLAPRAGSVRLLGTDLARLTASERDRFRGEHVGFVFQMFNLIPYLTVLENVMLPVQFSPARRVRIRPRELRAEAMRLLEALGLSAASLLDRPGAATTAEPDRVREDAKRHRARFDLRGLLGHGQDAGAEEDDACRRVRVRAHGEQGRGLQVLRPS